MVARLQHNSRINSMVAGVDGYLYISTDDYSTIWKIAI